jgi:hypothetical protein
LTIVSPFINIILTWNPLMMVQPFLTWSLSSIPWFAMVDNNHVACRSEENISWVCLVGNFITSALW